MWGCPRNGGPKNIAISRFRNGLVRCVRSRLCTTNTFCGTLSRLVPTVYINQRTLVARSRSLPSPGSLLSCRALQYSAGAGKTHLHWLEVAGKESENSFANMPTQGRNSHWNMRSRHRVLAHTMSPAQHGLTRRCLRQALLPQRSTEAPNRGFQNCSTALLTASELITMCCKACLTAGATAAGARARVCDTLKPCLVSPQREMLSVKT